MLNKKGQLDEINPAFAGLALLGGVIGWFVASRASSGPVVPILAGVGSVILVYLYLIMTDR